MVDAGATKSFHRNSASGPEGRLYLVVVEGGTSSLFELPRTGSIVIGRSDEADLRLADESASRRHARIVVADGEARIMDLGSHNGTRVNGELVAEGQALVSGDAIAICGATLVLQGAPPAAV